MSTAISLDFQKYIMREEALSLGQDAPDGPADERLGLYECQCGFSSVAAHEMCAHVKEGHKAPSNDWGKWVSSIAELVHPNPLVEVYPEGIPATDENVHAAVGYPIPTAEQQPNDKLDFLSFTSAELQRVSTKDLADTEEAHDARLLRDWREKHPDATSLVNSIDEAYSVKELPAQPGPVWDDGIMFGIAGDITRKIVSEAHPAAIYLDFLVAMGNLFGRSAFFSVGATRHYTNEFLVIVGPTSKGRKGTGQTAVADLIRCLDSAWFKRAQQAAFGSAQAIIHEIRDDLTQQIKKNVKGSEDPIFKNITIPGVADKRLFVREGEFSVMLNLANQPNSQTSAFLRKAWDGEALASKVKGQNSEGLSQTVTCAEPHVSISGGITASELNTTMPAHAGQNGFANRFLYCYAYRTRLLPHGGPQIDWSEEINFLLPIIEFAQATERATLSKAAWNLWERIYLSLEERDTGALSSYIDRASAHVKRLAMIFALLDCSSQIDLQHLHAAKNLWDYCEDSARFIFCGYTKDQQRIIKFVTDRKSVTLTQIREDLFQRNKKMEWIKLQINDLVRNGFLSKTNEQMIQRGKRS